MNHSIIYDTLVIVNWCKEEQKTTTSIFKQFLPQFQSIKNTFVILLLIWVGSHQKVLEDRNSDHFLIFTGLDKHLGHPVVV